MNRTLKEMTGAILRESHLPKEYWVEAIGYIGTLILQTRVVTENETAYERIFKRKPKLAELHPFGCQAYVHIPQESRSKGDLTLPKAWKGLLVGLPLDSTGYRVLNVESGRKINSRDVRFPAQRFHSEEKDEILDSTESILEESVEIVGRKDNSSDPVTSEPTDIDIPYATTPNPEPMAESPSVTQELVASTNDDQPENVQSTKEGEEQSENTVFVPPNTYNLRQRAPKVLLSGEPRIVSGDDTRPTWVLATQGGTTSPDPWTYAEAIQSLEADAWNRAMHQEFDNMEKAGTWENATLPVGKTLVGCKWVFKTKRNETGRIIGYKARIVAKGYSQVPGQDFDEISSPVARATSLRTILSIAAVRNLILGQMDFVAAYLNGVLDKVIYMECPPGYKPGPVIIASFY